MTELEKLAELRDRLREIVDDMNPSWYDTKRRSLSTSGCGAIHEAADLIDRIVSPSAEDVEVVARIIDPHANWGGVTYTTVDSLDKLNQMRALDVARAAIAAMGRLGRDG